jgi:hypothetical protein
MTYKIRKRENMTVYLASQVIELDPNNFRDLEENPYTGDSQEEFLNYINDFNIDDESLTDQLDEAVKDELQKLGENIKWTEFGNSAMNSPEIWLELGEEDKSYRRTGGFNISCSTNN